MPTWSSGLNLRGADGLSVLTGSGAPAAGLGVVNQAYIDLTAAVLYVKTSSGWPSTGKSLIGPASTVAGPQGLSVQSGLGAPSASLGNVGDLYIDTTNGILYAAKTSSGYPTPGKSLVGPASTVAGPQGLSVQSGSGAPAASLGAVGDIYVDTANGVLYAAKTSSGYPTPGKSLVGAASTVAGPQGISLQNGSGAPASTLGNVGDAYIDTTNAVLYGAKTASGYPTPGKSLIGPASTVAGPAGSVIYSATGAPPDATGIKGDYFYSSDLYIFYGPKPTATSWSGATQSNLKGVAGTNGVGTAGADGKTIRNGTAAPTNVTANVGDFYLQTSTPYTIYGPATAANTFPTTGVSLVGSAGADGKTIRNGTAAPTSSTTANVGDFYLQTGTSPVLYGPATAANTFPATGVSLVGPKGDTGTSSTSSTVGASGLTFNDGTVQNTAYPGAIALSTNAPVTGPPCWINGTSLTSTAIQMFQVGGSQVQYFVPPTASAFYSALLLNYNNSAAAITLQLYNLTDNVAIYTSSSLAAPTVTTAGPFAINTYPLAANKQYVWRVSGNGASYAYVLPQYYTPSSAPFATQYPPVSGLFTATTLSSTATGCKLAATGQTQYYKFVSGGYFTYAVFTNYSTATAAVFTLVGSATIYTSPSVAANSSLTVGPFGPASYPLPINTNLVWNVTGNGSATVAVNWAFVG